MDYSGATMDRRYVPLGTKSLVAYVEENREEIDKQVKKALGGIIGVCLKNTSNKFFLKLLTNIDGVSDYEILNSFSIKISINDKFDINSEAFKSFLNFSNYQIANHLSNSIYLTGVKPKVLEYKNEFAYHVTFLKNWNKIQNQGLIPKFKSNMEYYDSRIYLWIGDLNNDDFNYKIHSFGRLIKRINESDDEIIILKIN